MRAPRITTVWKPIAPMIHFKSASDGLKFADRDLFVRSLITARAITRCLPGIYLQRDHLLGNLGEGGRIEDVLLREHPRRKRPGPEIGIQIC
jgi:hypothetical protein